MTPARNYVPISAAEARRRYAAGERIAAAGERSWFTDGSAGDTVTGWFTRESLGMAFDQILPSRGGSFARPADAPVTLTRDQLRAVSELHLSGVLYRAGRARSLAGASSYRQSTLDALVAAGVARRAGDTSPDSIVPAVPVWADGYGTWYASVPNVVNNRADVARAAISGEVWSRSRDSRESGWRARVELARHLDPPEGFTYYRETSA